MVAKHFESTGELTTIDTEAVDADAAYAQLRKALTDGMVAAGHWDSDVRQDPTRPRTPPPVDPDAMPQEPAVRLRIRSQRSGMSTAAGTILHAIRWRRKARLHRQRREDTDKVARKKKASQEAAASLGLEGTAEEDAAAAKLQARQRGRQDRARVAKLKATQANEPELEMLMEEQRTGPRTPRGPPPAENPAESLGLEGTAEEDAAAAKLQAIQRGRQDRARVVNMLAEERGKKIEEELGLTGSAEETAAIARMQAQQRGRQDRKRVEELKAAQGGEAEAAAADDPAASLGLEGTAEEDAAAAKLQAIQRGRQDRARVAELKQGTPNGAPTEDGTVPPFSPAREFMPAPADLPSSSRSSSSSAKSDEGSEKHSSDEDMEGDGEGDPAASLGLEGTAEEDEAAAKLQAIQRGRQDRKRVQQMKG